MLPNRNQKNRRKTKLRENSNVSSQQGTSRVPKTDTCGGFSELRSCTVPATTCSRDPMVSSEKLVQNPHPKLGVVPTSLVPAAWEAEARR